MTGRWVYLLAIPILVGCGHEVQHDGEHEEAAAEHGAGREVHWGYDGETGPERWAELSPEFALCSGASEQSPIDLSGATELAGPALEREMGDGVITREQRATVMDLIDNGHTIQISNDVGAALDLDGEHYELVQYHFHAPSEHTIDGEHTPLEVHYVHKSAEGELAVVGTLVEEGDHLAALDPIIASLPSGPGDTRHVEDMNLDIDDLPPIADRYYRYRGSLTTPPCSEGVQWIVESVVLTASAEQLAAITPHLHGNNRPVQDLGERELLLISQAQE